jgi:hypothetical protein
MNMKRKLINMAVLSTLGLAGTAGAVTTGSTGQVLLYPYYTVRDGNDTLVTVVNTTDQPKAVKVRFLEAKNSQEVIDFNLYLSKHDVWTGVITTTATGAKLMTGDTSCTVPAIPTGGVEFRNFQYTGDFADGEDTSLNRTREGYLEIIEMGVPLHTVIGTDSNGDPIYFDTAITHKNGVPANCAAVVKDWADKSFTANSMSVPIGGMMGTGTLINVTNGTDFSYNPVILDDFSDTDNHTEPGSLFPALTQASPAESVVFYDNRAITSYWDYSNSANPVSALIMRTNVLNEFTVEPALAAGTDWVVNFPTKRFYVGLDVPTGTNDPDSAESNFDRPFTQDFKQNGACEEVNLTIYDREERTTTSDVDFSPPPPLGKNALCWEVNVLTFNNTDVLHSDLALNVPNQGFNSGWLNLGFAPSVTRPEGVFPRVIVSDENDTYVGLPVIGFGVQEYVNGNVGGVLSNYGGSFVHHYKRKISVGAR